MASTDTAIVVKQFVIAVSTWSPKEYGVWIPLEYFAEKIRHQLGYEQELTQGDIFKALESVIDRPFVDGSEDKISFGKSIIAIVSNRVRINVGQHGKRKRQVFLCFETKTKSKPPKSTTADFQLSYDGYYNRRKTIIDIRNMRQEQQVARDDNLHIDTNGNNDISPPLVPALVTPTEAQIVDNDITELLSSFINPKYLDKEDFFIADSIGYEMPFDTLAATSNCS